MDNPRIFVWLALAMLVVMNITTWNEQFATKTRPPAAPAATATAPAAPSAPQPDVANDALPPLPSAPAEAVPATEPAVASNVAQPSTAAPRVRVVTDVLDVDISTRGGELIRADLIKYPQSKDNPDDPVRLLSPDQPDLFSLASGLRADNNRAAPAADATFQAAATEYRSKSTDRQVAVPLTWTDGEGLKVVKTYIFTPGSYKIELRYDVTNESGSAWAAASFVQLFRHYVPVERSFFDVTTSAFRGPVLFDTKYRDFQLDDMEGESVTSKAVNGWLASVQHHFVVAALPPSKLSYDFSLKVAADKDYRLSYSGPLTVVPAGGKQVFSETLFVGPKLYEQIAPLHEKLYLTADYGMFKIIAEPLFWILSRVHEFLGNWGWSIVVVTLLIKLAFYKLTAASGRSMAKMRNLGPRIKAIQERYKDDREQLGRQMMDIYKREKINPLAGCLPVLIQIPFFFAYYCVLLEAVEIRQAPFFGWINDLSARDPYFILPALMCAAMVGQFKLQPMPSTDPVQAKIFAFMPVVMSITMAFFPAGLVLYWLTNTLLSIAQQWRINQLVALEDKKPSLEKRA